MHDLHGELWEREKDARYIAKLRYTLLWTRMLLVLVSSMLIVVSIVLIQSH